MSCHFASGRIFLFWIKKVNYFVDCVEYIIKTEMKIEWNNCFLCLNDLSGQQVSDKEDVGGRRGNRKKDVERNSKKNLEKESKRAQLLINYLLTNKSDKHSGVIRDVKQLLEAKKNGGSGVNFCEKCEGQVNRVAELHQELEVVQMKLVSVLKAVKQTVVQNLKRDGGIWNVGLEIFEQWLREQESNFSMEAGKREENRRLKEQQKILETVEVFQKAVIENEKESVDIPLVFLERCTAFRAQPSEQLLPFSEVTVKTEVQDLQDNLDSPMSDLDEQLSNLAPGTAAPKRKYKKRLNCTTDIEIKREVLRPPRASTSTARLKMIEMTNSYKKRKRGPASHGDGIRPAPRKRFKVPPFFRLKAHSKVKRGGAKQMPHHLYCCSLCPFTTFGLHSLEEHLQNHEAEAASKEDAQPPPFQCDICPNSKLNLEQSSEFHKLKHNGHYTILCEPCNSWLPPLTFKDHLKSHQEKIFPCPNCSYCGTTREQYLSHLFDHHFATSILECDICGLRSSGRPKFLEHYFEVHQAIEKLICGVDGCSKEFLDPLVLKRHKNIHTEKFKCAHCKKVFVSQTGLETHMMLHTGDKRWTCDQCEDAYTTKLGLQMHKIRSHGAPKVKCEYCGKGFSNRTGLKNHQVTHTGVGYRCDFEGCGKAFGTRKHLRSHAASHLEEKRLVCDECGKRFSFEVGLRRHKKIHEGEAAKHWKCQYCGKAFLFERYLIPHVRIHTGEKPFVCDACGKDFNQYAALYMHKRKCQVGTSAPPQHSSGESTDEIKATLN